MSYEPNFGTGKCGCGHYRSDHQLDGKSYCNAYDSFDRYADRCRCVSYSEEQDETAMAIEAFARHLHEDTGPWGQDKTGEPKVGASPIGYCTWEDASEEWRDKYRAVARGKAGLE